jgi:uncharacterized protein YcfJ
MKRFAIAVASLFTAIGPAAHAAYDRYGNYYEPSDYRSSEIRDSARVIDSRPVYASADSRQECYNTRSGRYEIPATQSSSRVGAGAAVGAVAGGVLGHQVGSGHGNDAATIGGALLGGLIGHQIEKDRREDRSAGDFDMSRCRVVATSGETLQGYDVRYVYRGQEYTARMSSDPGRRLVLGRDIRDDGTPYDYVADTTTYSYNEPTWR